MCAVYCLDVNFVTDISKFVAGVLQATSAMVQLELAHVNVLTKVDLMEDKVRFPNMSARVHVLARGRGWFPDSLGHLSKCPILASGS